LNNSKYAPAALLVQKVAEGKLGVKTGEGFYKY
jgi:3-hydroxyacyl-CoA dehydrogenase